MLLAAGRALLDQALLVAVGTVVAAPLTAKALGPPDPHQIGPALRVGTEALEERRQVTRQPRHQIVAHARPNIMFMSCSLCQPTHPPSSFLSLLDSDSWHLLFYKIPIENDVL